MVECDMPLSGRFVGTEHRYPCRVYFEDTDAGGVVYHANYLRFMERARTDMLRLVGIGQRAAIEAGEGVYVVADLSIRYRKPARLDDALLVVSRMTAVRAASCVVHQTVMRGAEILTEGEITVAFLNPDGRPRRQPPAWVKTFSKLVES
jgi:acyl-CoA thioester hydrolase